MAEQALLKHGLNQASVQRIATALTSAWPEFNQSGFTRAAVQGLDTLELKQRVEHIIETLHQFLPQDFGQTSRILCTLAECWDRGPADDPLRGFAVWPLTDYVASYGLEAPEQAMQVMAALSQYFSAEFAIRPFLQQHFKLAHRQLLSWAKSDDEHLRRLASEGCRPRLPWGKQLPRFIREPEPVLAVLELLKYDSSLYVRRSVANNLNDISKDNPDLVIKTCERWLQQQPDNPELQWLVKHATRSLVKLGHTEVFPLLGYSAKPDVDIIDFRLSHQRLTAGEELSFDITLKSKSKQRFVLDYAIHFMKANGQQSAKVFKLKNCSTTAKEHIQFQKKHSFKKISTRQYHPGEHALSIIVNGKEIAKRVFQLMPAIA